MENKSWVNKFDLTEKPDFVKNEEKVLEYWKGIKAFEQQLEKTKGFKPYTFYDGPPFATGTPHYGHICAGTIKDVITRYASMTGRFVERKFGWDCHGLPVEYIIDKKLKINNRKEVLAMGVDKYNQECRSIVMTYQQQWKDIVHRLGRWIDFDDSYKTMDLKFMESVWWVFKQIFEKGLVYQGCKVMPYSNKCNTVLSNFEATLNYRDVSDPSLVLTFPLVKDGNIKFLAWTTTPWTLPTNLALIVNPNFEYVKIKDLKTNMIYILAKCRLGELYQSAKKEVVQEQETKQKKDQKKINKKKAQKSNKAIKQESKQEGGQEQKIQKNTETKKEQEQEQEQEFEILETYNGKDLEGVDYVPLFNYYYDKMKPKGCFKVLCSDFVTSEDGTGVVHASPAYGDDDYKVCLKYKIIEPNDPCVSVDENGHFFKEVVDFQGMYIKDADPLIIQNLKERGRLIKQGTIVHSYPYCWRSNTPLIYKAVTTWFIKVTSIKEDLIKNNKEAYWVPQWAQEKRFNNWLEDAQDWCFSRNRFWGNPIPLWVSDDLQEMVCVGSVEELRKRAKLPEDYQLDDLHKEFIDKIQIPSEKGKGMLKRIDEVFDCWFESGSMPYASFGYPKYMSTQEFETRFPAEFIGEGLDQTRGWFYTLNVIGTILYNKCPYKNLIVNGIVLDEKGEKLSKSKQNYPDPSNIINSIGSDPLRLYLMNSPLVRGEVLKFSENGLKQLVKDVFIPLYNLCRLLLQEIIRYECQAKSKFVYNEKLFYKENAKNFDNTFDQWILARTHLLVEFIHQEFEAYRLYTILDKKLSFLDDLSRWYVNINKSRFKGDQGLDDSYLALNVLFHCFLTSQITIAPFVPFITDYFYLTLRDYIPTDTQLYSDSIHFLSIPKPIKEFEDQILVESVRIFQNILTSVRYLREKRKINLRQPIMSLKVMIKNSQLLEEFKCLENYLKDEANVLEIQVSNNYEKYIEFNILPNDKFLGQQYLAKYSALRPLILNMSNEQKELFFKNKIVDLQFNFEGKKETVTLNEESLILRPVVILKPSSDSVDISGDCDFALEIDFTITEELRLKGMAREMINKIQRFRKASKQKIDDQIFILLEFNQESQQLLKPYQQFKQYIQQTLRKPLLLKEEVLTFIPLHEIEEEVDQCKFKIIIAGPSFVMNQQELRKEFGDENLGKIELAMKGIDPIAFLKEGKKEVDLMFEKKRYQLFLNKHFIDPCDLY